MFAEQSVSATGSSDHLLRRELQRIDRLLALAWEGRHACSAPAAMLAALSAEHAGSADGARLAAERPAELPGLARIVRAYELSPFDRDLLLLAAAPEIDSRYGELLSSLACAPVPSLGQLVDVVIRGYGLPRDVALSRTADGAPLFRNALLRRLGDAQAAPGQRTVSVPDAVWRRMLGIDGGCVFELSARHALDDLVLAPETRAACVHALEWARTQAHCVLVVRGRLGRGRSALAAALADALKRRALCVDAQAELSEVAREARWFGAIPVLSANDGERTRKSVELARLAEAVGVVIVIAGAGVVDADIPLRDLEVAALTRAERARIWMRALGLRAADSPSVEVDAVVDRRLGPGRIFAAARRARERTAARASLSREDLLYACRLVGGEEIGGAADRVEPRFVLDDLILPQATRRELELAIAWGRQLESLSARCGPHLASGRGLACLFSGPPGTGKTSAAQVLARELGLELYRVDLSRVVDKYIGETEKQLARLFDQAELHNFVLLFDEADALFGRRTDVQDAHDRFANIETSYLLQRLEQHQGIAVLATNLRNNLDPAFLRRLHVIADFPLPNAVERRLLWERLLPKPRADDVDFELLASRFALSGGDIRNAVMAALVLAGDGPIAMRHLVVGLWREQSRSGRLLDGNEFGRWQSELASWVGRRP